jgi:HAD superfamily hydrolase (TIGR01509 family)
VQPGDIQHSVYHAASVILAWHGLRPSPGRVSALARLISQVIVAASRPAPGARELLEWVHSRGVAVAIVSNNWCGHCILEALERDGLSELVDVVVSSDWVGYRKPRREILEAALTLLSADPERSLYIDDVGEYVEAARSLGVHALVHDGRRLDEYIPVVEELLLKVDEPG